MHACNYYLLNDVHALVYNFIHMHARSCSHDSNWQNRVATNGCPCSQQRVARAVSANMSVNSIITHTTSLHASAVDGTYIYTSPAVGFHVAVCLKYVVVAVSDDACQYEAYHLLLNTHHVGPSKLTQCCWMLGIRGRLNIRQQELPNPGCPSTIHTCSLSHHTHREPYLGRIHSRQE